ncbi:MAG: hypothetical protein HRT93_01265 [Piscirickettsiaceae bacterium]|nr:hypothetical protein [Piscirickettsiaceae bacterium]
MKLKKTVLLGAGLLSVASLISTPALADDAAMLKLIRILEHNGTINADAALALKDAVTVQETAQAEKTQMAIEAATKDNLKITTNGKLAIESPDGDYKFKFNGRIMADQTFVDSDDTNLSSGSELRRARIGFGGTIFKVWDFQLTSDFGGSSHSVKDAYIRYKGFENNKITVGNHHSPFAMELADSSKYMTFIERSIGSELIQGASGPGDRRNGISSFHNGDNWTAQYGVFGTNISKNTGTDDRLTYSARATFAPIHEKTHALHFGGGYAYQDFDRDGLGVRLRTRPGTHIGPRWLDSSVTADGAEFLTLDAAYVNGPFSVQAEYDRAMIDASTGSDVDVDSYFVQADWFLTGESRNYKASSGHFSSVRPKGEVGKGGIGAWQIGARFASADMNDGTHIGGELDVLTLGLNWYATKNIRFMANYNTVLDVKDGNVPDGDEPSSFVLRSQVYW